jgi:hypothetical protein
LLRARVRRSFSILLHEFFALPPVLFVYGLFLLGVGYVLYALITGSATEGSASAWAWWLVALVGSPIVVYGLVLAFNPAERVAQQTAIDLHREQLEGQGWHTFWPDKEYEKLAPETTHQLGLPR